MKNTITRGALSLWMLLLGAAGLVPLSASGQTPAGTLYASNGIDLHSALEVSGFRTFPLSVQRAQAFTIGGREGGYRLSSVRIHMSGYDPGLESELLFSLHEASGTHPYPVNGNKVVDFIVPPPGDSVGDWYELVPAQETVLERQFANDDGKYWVLVKLRNRANAVVHLSQKGAETTTLEGWIVTASSRSKRGRSSSWDLEQGRGIAIEVRGEPVVSADPVITLELDNGSIGEGGSAAVTAVATPAPDTDVDVRISVAPEDGMTRPSDYWYDEELVLRIPAGETRSNETFSILSVDDSIRRDDRLLRITGTADGEGVDDSQATATLKIVEDDNALPAPSNLRVRAMSDRVLLEWDAGDVGLSDLEYEYRRRTGSGAYGEWKEIYDSKPGERYHERFWNWNLAQDTTYGFQLRAVEDDRTSAVLEAEATTFAPFTAEFTALQPFEDGAGITGEDTVVQTLTFSDDLASRILLHEVHGLVDLHEQSKFMGTEYVGGGQRTVTMAVKPMPNSKHLTITLKAPPEEERFRCTQAEVDNREKICSTDLRPLQDDVTVTVRAVRDLRLEVDPRTIDENGGVATVTATLAAHSSAVDETSDVPFEVDIAVEPVLPAVAADYAIEGGARLSFRAGERTARGEVRIVAQDNAAREGGKTLRVRAVPVGDSEHHIRYGGAAELSVTDDEMTNAAPTAQDGRIGTDLDTAHVFAPAEFGFADADPDDALAGVRIVTLPARGALTLDGAAVAADAFVAAADIDAGGLVYTPPAGESGEALGRFTFRVSDGSEESAADYAMAIDVRPDTEAPEIETAVADGDTLVLTYGEELDGGSVPGTGAFTVRSGGTSRPVSGVSVSGATVTLTLSSSVGHGEEVRLSYAVPSADPLQDASENPAAALADYGVRNDTPDTTAPELETAVADGGTVVLTYGEDLDSGSVPAATAFAVTVDGTVRALAASDPVSVSGSTVTLTLSSPVDHGEAVTVSYAVPSSNPLRDEAENPAAGLADHGVRNDTPDTTAPELETAVADGETLVLTYGEDLDADSVPAATAFAVTVEGTARALAASDPVTISGATVTLTLSSSLGHGEEVRLSYAVPSADPLQDASENPAAALADHGVRNETPDTTAPELETAVVDGDRLVLTYGEELDEGSVPAATAFAVTVEGAARALAVADPVSVSGATVTLVLASSVLHGEEVRLSYAAPSSNPLEDDSGNPAAALTDHGAENETPPDETAPRAVSATLSGTSLTVTFDELLGLAPDLSNSAFRVTKTVSLRGGLGGTVTVPLGSAAPAVSGSAVTLTLAGASTERQINLAVHYTRPDSGTDNRIVDRSRNEAESFTNLAVVDEQHADSGPPALRQWHADGDAVVLTFNKALDEDSVPDTGTFTVWVGEVNGPPAAVSVDFTTVTLTLAAPAAAGQAVWVAYSPPADADAARLRGVRGSAAPSFSLRVPNVTTDDTPPTVHGAAHPSAPSLAEEARIVLKFDEPIDGLRVPPTDAFEITADGFDGPDGAYALVGFVRRAGPNELLLGDLSGRIYTDMTVRVRYTAPADAGADVLRDLAGNAAVDFFVEVDTGDARTPVPPAGPGGLTAAANGSGRIDLSWTAPAGGAEPPVTGYRIEWSADGTTGWTEAVADTGTTATQWSDTGLSGGMTRHYRVMAMNRAGAGTASESASATTPGTGGNATGAPEISGQAKAGMTLAVRTDGIGDPDGLGDFSYRWVRLDGSDGTDIPGATSPTHALTAADAGHRIRVRVEFTDGSGNRETVTSASFPDAGSVAASDDPGPGLQSGAISADGRFVDLTFDVDLDVVNLPLTGAFRVEVDALQARVADVQAGDGPRTIRLAVEPAVIQGQVVRVGYADPTPGDDPAAIQDASGNDAAGFAGFAVTNLSIEGDATAPELETAVVDGDTLVLTYGEDLDEGSVPGAGAFTVDVDGTARGLATSDPVSVSGSTVTLTLSSPVGHGEAVKLSYTAPPSNPLQDASENPVASVTDHGVRNDTPDTAAPELETAVVGGDTLVLTYGEDLDADSVPAATAFAVTVEGTARGLAASDPVSVSGSTVTLTLSSAVGHGEEVKLSYTAPPSNPLQDASENPVASVTDHGVRNDTPDTTAPELETAVVDGDTLVLTYGEDLDGDSVPAATAFAVTVEGTARALATSGPVSVSGSTVTLTLSSPVGHGEEVKLSYTAPPSNPLQDASENPVASVTDHGVRNDTPDTAAPELETAVVDGDTLVLTYGEDLDGDSVPAATAFAVTVEGTARALATSGPVSVSGSTVTLTLSSPVGHGEAVSVSYAVPSSNPLQDESGNPVAALADHGVRNETPDTTAPELETAVVDRDTLVLTYGENLDEGSVPGAGAFTVRSGGTSRPVSGVSVSGSTVTLTLSSPVGHDETVTVSYAVPSSNPLRDEAENPVAALTDHGVRNDTPDTTAPELETAVADGDTLVLTYGENLDEGSVPGAGAFTVRSGGTSRPVSGVSVSGSTVTLTLSSPVGHDETVTVSYAVPSSNPLRDEAENPVAALTDHGVRNDTPDTTAPELETAVADGDTLVLTYGENLDEGSVPGAGAFTVRSGGTSRPVSGVSVSGSTVTLTLSSPVGHDETVSVSYAVPSSNPLRDEAENPVAALADHGVRNDTPDTAAPELETAVVDGDTLVLTYGEDLDADSIPAATAFAVTVDGTERALAAGNPVSVSGATVTLTLSSSVGHGEAVTLSYAVPSSNPLQDDSGNPVAALTDHGVRNETPDTTAPELETAVVDGDTLVLTYGEDLDADSVPAATAFAVTVEGAARALAVADPVSVSGATVTLVLASSVLHDEAVTLSYAVPSSNPLQDDSGNLVAALTDHGVRNETPDTTAPELETAVVDGDTLVLTYGENLDADSVPAATAFAVTVEGAARALAVADPVSVSGATVTLVLASSVLHDEAVTLSYAVPSSNPLRDEAENPVAALADHGVRNKTPDTTAPELETAVADGDTLVLTYGENLDEGSVPGAGAFTVRSGGTSRPVSGVSVSGSTVTLTLSSAVGHGEAVSVSYAVPSSNPLRDEAENPVAALADHGVRNDTPDTTAPELETAVVDGDSLVLTYGEDLDADSVPAATAFAVTVDGTERALAAGNPVSVSGATVTLTLSSSVGHGEAVTLSYVVPSSNPLEDDSGNPVAALADYGVRNDTPDTTAPELETAVADGDTLVLTYGEDLDADSIPAATAFAVTVDGTERALAAGNPVSVSGATVTLTLSSSVGHGEAVTLSYVVPSSNPLQDASGNPVVALVVHGVRNDTPDTTAPELETAVVDGDSLILTYGENLDADSVPAATAFAVTVEGTARALAAGNPVSVSGATVTLTLSSAVSHGEAVTLSYVVPSSNPLQDGSGNPVAALVDHGVRNDTPDEDAPEFKDAAVDGDTLVLTYGEELDEGSVPATTAFAVTVDGTARALAVSDPVIVTGATVTLTLSSSVDHGEVVTVSYAVPSTNPLLDVSGNPVAALVNHGARNDTPDTTAPDLETAVVDGDSLVLTYGEDLDADSVPAATAFAVTVEGTARALVASDPVSVSGDRVTLTLSTSVGHGEEVKLNYTAPPSNPLQDASENPVASVTDYGVRNDTPDTTAPELETAVVDGNSLILTYGEDLDEGSVPGAGAFTVRSGGTSRPVSGVSVSGTTVTVTLSSPVGHGETVSVSYAVPSTNPLQDASGNPVAALADHGVRNKTPDTTAPELETAVADGNSLILTYGEDLDQGSVPGAGAFTVRSGGTSRPVSGVSVSGATVTLTLSSSVGHGEAVSVSYAVPSSNPLEDASGNPVAALVDYGVRNDTPDTTAPELETAVVDGDLLILTYGEDLDQGSVPGSGAFTVNVDGTERALAAGNPVSVSGATVTLTLSSSVGHGEAVTLSYVVPSSNPLQDASGNPVAALADHGVRNETPDTAAPELETAVADGDTLVLIYGEDLDEGSVPGSGVFTVRSGGTSRPVSGVSVSGSTVMLTLSSPVGHGEAVTLSYAVSSSNPLQDASGNPVAALADHGVRNDTPDTTAPELETAVADGDTLVLTYGEDLDEGSVPGAGTFTVRSGGTSRPVSGVSISGATVTLTLSSSVGHGEAVSVSYAVPSSNPLQDDSGNPVAALADHGVRNETPDTTAPELETAVVDGDTLVLTYGEDLDADSVPAATAFAVTVDGTERALTTSDPVSVSGATVTLTLSSPVGHGETVSVSYAVPSTNPLQDASGNPVAALADHGVRNKTPDTTAPELETAVADGNSLILTYGEDLDQGSVPGAGAFTVRSGGTSRPVSGVSVSGATVTLTLSSSVGHGEAVTLSYSVPSSNPLQDASGNPVVALAAHGVRNDTPDTTAPELETAVVDEDSLVLTYGEDLDADSVPAATAFAVTVEGTARALAAGNPVSVSGATVTLTLSSAVSHGEAVTLSYSVPSSNPLQDGSGNPVAVLADRGVRNDTPEEDLLDEDAPELQDAVADGDSLVLTYGEDLDADSVPAATAFAVTVEGTARALAAGNPVSVSGATVTLTLSTSVGHGEAVTLSYVVPSSNPLQDASGNPVAALADHGVTNSTPASAPTLDSAVLAGASLRLTFNGDLDASTDGTPENSAFTVMVTDSRRTAESASLSGKPAVGTRTVTLTLTAAPAEGMSVTVAYSKPGSGGKLRGAGTGAEVDSFSAREVTRTVAVSGAPVITAPNVFQVPATLGVDLGSVTGIGEDDEVRYRWIRVDADGTSNPVEIGTGENHTLSDPDAGKRIRVEVGFGEAGNGRTVTSAAYPSRTTVRAAGTCNAPALTGGAELIGSGRALVLGSYTNPQGTYRGYYGRTDDGMGFGGLDDVTFRIGGARYTLKAVAHATREGVADSTYVKLNSALSAGHRRTLVLHVCDRAYAFGEAAQQGSMPQYEWPDFVLPAWYTAERTLYLSRDTVAPTVVSASAAGASLVITFSEDLGASASLPNSAFTVKRTPQGGGEETVALSATAAPVVSGREVTLTLASAIVSTDAAIRVSYAVPDSGSGRLADRFGNGVAGFADRAVTHGNGGDGEPGTNTVSVAGDDVPFTGSFLSMPPEHDGTTPFTVELRFSEEPQGLSYRTVRDGLFTVTGGKLAKAERTAPPSNRRFTLTLEPAGNSPVTLARAASLPDCGQAGAVCTGGGRALSGALGLNVPGPAAVSAADARVREAEGAKLAFTVSLDRARHAEVTVDYATRDGTATAGADYTSTSGTLTFNAGETSKTVEVPVLDDTIDEDSEAMTLVLSNAAGARIADGEATGTIENTDAMPGAWLGRFGRTVADQVLDAVASRAAGERSAGTEVTLAGERVGNLSAEDRRVLESLEEVEAGERGLTLREFLSGSSFAMTSGTSGEGFGAVWGRGAVSSFSGREDGGVSLEGDVESLLLGMDYQGGDTAFGVMLAHSLGEGTFTSAVDGGDLESDLTGIYPWGRHALSDRLSVWGAGGYGSGTLKLTPEGQGATETDMDLVMLAGGLRGELLSGGAGGRSLAATADWLGVRTSSDRARTPAGGILAGADATVTRFRVGLEGSMALGLGEGGGLLTPMVELGLRHDDGDAETGFGADMGLGVTWSAPSLGLEAALRGRGLLTHESDGFDEEGFSGSLVWDPSPDTDRGVSLKIGRHAGAEASGGVRALFDRGSPAGIWPAEEGAGGVGGGHRRLEATLGYGLPAFGGRYTATPEIGYGESDGGRDLRLGWRLTRTGPGGIEFGFDVGGRHIENVDDGTGHEFGLGFGWRLEEGRPGGMSFDFRVEGMRRDLDAGTVPEHGLGLKLEARW